MEDRRTATEKTQLHIFTTWAHRGQTQLLIIQMHPVSPSVLRLWRLVQLLSVRCSCLYLFWPTFHLQYAASPFIFFFLTVSTQGEESSIAATRWGCCHMFVPSEHWHCTVICLSLYCRVKIHNRLQTIWSGSFLHFFLADVVWTCRQVPPH